MSLHIGSQTCHVSPILQTKHLQHVIFCTSLDSLRFKLSKGKPVKEFFNMREADNACNQRTIWRLQLQA